MKILPSKGKQQKEKTKVKAGVAKLTSRTVVSKSAAKKSPTKTTGSKTKPSATGVSAKSASKAAKKTSTAKTKPMNKLTPKETKATAANGSKSIPKAQINKAHSKTSGANGAKTQLKKPLKPLGKTGSPARGERPKPSPVTGKVSTVNLKSRTGAKVTLPVVISTPPPPPEPPRRQLSSGSLRAFEHAVKIFNRRHFDDAKEMFDHLLDKFPNDVEVVARAQMYIQVCKQKIAHDAQTPRNPEELYDRGVFALNIGDFSQARQFFEKALRMRPDEPYLLYSLAATHAQAGALEQALDYLKRSIQLQPKLRSQAYNDADFSGLRENKQFLDLLGLTSPFDLLESKQR
jgi:tetratricopeptide (TPR) repeat protein